MMFKFLKFFLKKEQSFGGQFMYKYVKQLLEFLLSLVGLIILSPLFLIIAIWIKSDSPGPIF